MVIQQTKKQLEDQKKERKRLEEVVLEKDGDIQGLLQGGGNFQLIKSLFSDLTASMASIEEECEDSDNRTQSIKAFMSFLDDFSKPEKRKASAKKKRPSKLSKPLKPPATVAAAAPGGTDPASGAEP